MIPDICKDHECCWQNEGDQGSDDREDLVHLELASLRVLQTGLEMFMGGVEAGQNWQQTNGETCDPTQSHVYQATCLGHLALKYKYFILTLKIF